MAIRVMVFIEAGGVSRITTLPLDLPALVR
jgi:hypothetical protein